MADGESKLPVTGFFRPEVFHHRQRQSVGRVLLVPPLASTVLAALALCAACALAAWLSFGTYTRKARIDGVLTADSAGRVRIELFAGAATLRWLNADQPMHLRYPVPPGGSPSPSSASIVSVSRSPVAGTELGALPTWVAARAAREPVYRLLARPVEGGVPQAAAGMAVQADVQSEKRRLIEWMFSPRERAAGPA